jgi:hypothetical protein
MPITLQMDLAGQTTATASERLVHNGFLLGRYSAPFCAGDFLRAPAAC